MYEIPDHPDIERARRTGYPKEIVTYCFICKQPMFDEEFTIRNRDCHEECYEEYKASRLIEFMQYNPDLLWEFLENYRDEYPEMLRDFKDEYKNEYEDYLMGERERKY